MKKCGKTTERQASVKRCLELLFGTMHFLFFADLIEIDRVSIKQGKLQEELKKLDGKVVGSKNIYN